MPSDLAFPSLPAKRPGDSSTFPPCGNTLFLGLCELAEGVFPPCVADISAAMASLLWCSLVTKTCSTLSTFVPEGWMRDHRGWWGGGGRAVEISDILAEEQQQFSWGSLCSGLGKNICIPFLNKKNPSKPNKKKSQQQKIVLRFGFAFTSYLYLCFPPSLHNPKYHALIC